LGVGWGRRIERMDTDHHMGGTMDHDEAADPARREGRRDFLTKGGALALGATAATAGAVGFGATAAGAAPLAPLYLPVTPERVYDSRDPGAGGLLNSGFVRTLTPDTPPPDTLLAFNLNVTIVDTVGTGFISVFPGGETWPGNSTVNWFGPNFILANTAFTGWPADGSIQILCGGGGATDFVLDVTAILQVTDLATVTSVSALREHTASVGLSTSYSAVDARA
jgi:hypothetical protein